MVLIRCACNNDSAEFHQVFAGSYQDGTPIKLYHPTSFVLHYPDTTLTHTCFSDILSTGTKPSLRSLGFLPVLAVFPMLLAHKLWTPLRSQWSDACISYDKTFLPAGHSSTDISSGFLQHFEHNEQWCSCPVSATPILNNAKNQATGAKTASRSWINKDDLYGLHHLLRLSGN